MKFLLWFFGLFSKYVNSFERRVDKFFRNVKSTDSIVDIREGLLELMQENLIAVNVWLEKRFKGYKYLTKSVRRKMYEDTGKMVKKFEEFVATDPAKLSSLKAVLAEKGLGCSTGDLGKLRYLFQIMHFFRPGQYYKYIRTASFGKLLRDPDERSLEGDCNQIVTLYAYFYSLKYPLKDLQIKLLPEHVCLHFRGIDIEATNGTFQKYKELDVLPITEIISTNLLDLTDFREDVQEIDAREMVKSAQLAYAISSLKTLVAKNLNIAYQNLAIAAMNANDFETAVFYFEKAGDRSNMRIAKRNAAIYYLKNKNYSKAKYYAERDRELLGQIEHAEYVVEYNRLVKKVSSVKTVDDARKHKSDFNKMLHLAQKMGDSELEKSVRKSLEQI